MYLSEIISEDVKHKYRMSPSQSLYLSLMRTILKEKKSQQTGIFSMNIKKKTKTNTKHTLLRAKIGRNHAALAKGKPNVNHNSELEYLPPGQSLC